MAIKSPETLIKEKIKAYINQGILDGRKSVAKNISYDFGRDVYYVNFHYGVQNGKRKKQTQTFPSAKLAVEALTDFETEKCPAPV